MLSGPGVPESVSMKVTPVGVSPCVWMHVSLVGEGCLWLCGQYELVLYLTLAYDQMRIRCVLQETGRFLPLG